MTKTLEGRIYAALVAASEGKTNLLELASDLANGIKHQVHLELEMLEESAREREAAKFEIGVHVGILDTKYEGMKGVIVAGESFYWEVKIDGITHPVHFPPESLKPFPKSAQPPQPEPPAPPAFAVGTRVKLTEEHWGFPAGTTGQVARIHKANPNVVYVRIHGEEDIYRSPFHTNALEPLNSNLIPKGTFSDEPLPSDPGAPAGALPAGVALSERSTSDTDIYHIESEGGVSEGFFRLEHTHSSALFGLHYGDEHTYLFPDELARLVALGQYLLGKTGGDNGLH